MTAPLPENEIWRWVVGLEGRYEVSSIGRVRSHCRGARGIMRQHLHTGGYPSVGLVIGGKQITHTVHSLVVAAFIGKRPDGFLVCHNNGDPADNRAANLRYDTAAANSLDMVRHGRSVRGEQSPRAKLCACDVRAIRALRGRRTYREIAGLFGVSFTTVQKVMSGAGWTHVR